MKTRRSRSTSPRVRPSVSISRVMRNAETIDALPKCLEGRFDHRAQIDLGDLELLFACKAQQVCDRTLDPIELFERDPGVADALVGGRVLAHLLHQTLGRRDRIADLVGDRRGELVQRARVLVLEIAAFAQGAALHLERDLAFDQTAPQVREDQRGEEVQHDPDPPARGDDKNGRKPVVSSTAVQTVA